MKKIVILLLTILSLSGCDDDLGPEIRLIDICCISTPFEWTQTENELVELTVQTADAGNYKLTIKDTGDPACDGEIKVLVF